MIKKIFMVLKKIIVGILLIYTYNIIVFPIGIIIPMNIFTIFFVSFFGIYALIALCLFSIFIV